MNDTLKIIALLGVGGAAGYWFCTSYRTRSNPDAEMEQLLESRLNSLEAGGSSGSKPRKNPYEDEDLTDDRARISFLERRVDRMIAEQRAMEKMNRDFGRRRNPLDMDDDD